MFCDLVGSTSISAGLDAEDWRDLVGAYLDVAAAAVTAMGGQVAKKLGDGVMALFGYPVAQENDAERAARAALAIQRALAEVNRKNADTSKPALNARIGIETGPVVVDATGEVYGDAPNIAARVQALAEPGAILVTAGVQRQIAGLFVVEERGSHELKGVPEPATLSRLERASGGGRRAGQRHLTPLIGREEEIAMLMRRWERARQGEGQLVLIVGEPGALALLCNTLPTGAILTVLILTFGPLSGAHFNPAVSVAFALRGEIQWRDAGYYVAAQSSAQSSGCGLRI
jgi:class 3 adenylate cyclase